MASLHRQASSLLVLKLSRVSGAPHLQILSTFIRQPVITINEGLFMSATSEALASRSKAANRSHPSKKSATRTPDAIALLKADHAKVKKMFKEFDKLKDAGKKQDLANVICSELKVHTTIEEEIFYPAAREALADDDLLDEAEVEHASAKDLIAQIEGSSPDGDKWDAKVKVLGEYIDHHVEEEHTEMFPKVRKTRLDLKALGQELLLRKKQLAADAG
jgi:hemerythrin-like domain-containing protein